MDLYEHGQMDVQTRLNADSELTKHYSTVGIPLVNTVESLIPICNQVALIANNFHMSRK